MIFKQKMVYLTRNKQVSILQIACNLAFSRMLAVSDVTIFYRNHMFKKILLCGSLLVGSISCADVSEAEAAQLAQDIEAGMEIIKAVGGFYFVSVSKIPAAQTKTITKILSTASHSEFCVDFRTSPEEQMLVFAGAEGAQEAKELKQLLEKKGCVVELIELVNP